MGKEKLRINKCESDPGQDYNKVFMNYKWLYCRQGIHFIQYNHAQILHFITSNCYFLQSRWAGIRYRAD